METFIAFIIVLGALIFVHELGHFLLAKLLGVGVLKFSLGFGPKLVGAKIGETEYLISALPLGGYVKMVGESPGEDVPSDMEGKSFSKRSAWAKMLIVLAGPLFNIFFAVFLLSSLWVYGVPTLTARIGEVKTDLPAYEAGIREGDIVIAIMGKPITMWEEMARFIHEAEGPISMKLKRGGNIYEVMVTPQSTKAKNIFGEEEEVKVIGISASGETVIVKYDPFTAFWKGTYQSLRLVGFTIVGIKKLIERKVPLGQLGGPILIAQLSGEQVKQGLRNFIFFIALLSVNLGIINLLPIPILDGGHILFFTIELVLRRPLNEKGMEIAQKVGMAVLILIMALAFYNDIIRLVSQWR